MGDIARTLLDISGMLQFHCRLAELFGGLHRDHEAFTELLAHGGLRTGDVLPLLGWVPPCSKP